MNLLLAAPVVLPILAGIPLFCVKGLKDRRAVHIYSAVCLAVYAALVWVNLFFVYLYGSAGYVKLMPFVDTVTLTLTADGLSAVFAGLTSVIWVLVGIYAMKYMHHEENEHIFFGFYLIVGGILIGRDFSANMVTLYFFYEMMSLLTVPMVMHTRTPESIRAAMKYMFYSVAGAMLILFAMFVLNRYCTTLDFNAGGTLNMEMAAGHEGLILFAAFIGIIGFGTKAGMFPLHAWLPAAHPVAPSPASAVLSGIITKAGVLGIIRMVYYLIGASFIRGTWVQTVWMVLALLTVFMGSMMAYMEPVMKKRMAYSTVSQVSYILFGLSVMNPEGFVGAVAHVVYHSLIKNTLFMAAGAIIFHTGITKVKDLRGIGKQMPVIIWCYTFASLALIGIPPCSGFISKWYLATGSLMSGVPGLNFIGPVILLISAILTAGYLLPITINGFLPGDDYDYKNLKIYKPGPLMTIPLIITAGLSVILGLFAAPLINWIMAIAQTLM